jgi:hypothetical protein
MLTIYTLVCSFISIPYSRDLQRQTVQDIFAGLRWAQISANKHFDKKSVAGAGS